MEEILQKTTGKQPVTCKPVTCNLPKANLTCNSSKTIFVSGIDTDAGKSVVTGLLARSLRKRGVNVITQKFIQTGWVGVSEDIQKHRKIMGIEPQPEDVDDTTCPYVMTYPASPHLAAEIDKVTLDTGRIEESTRRLESMYDMVLLEGAGGLYVPVTREYFTIDYIADHRLPLILVASSKLGSINHTLMSLEVCRARGIEIVCLVYNRFPNDSEWITNDSITIFRQYLEQHFPGTALIEVPVVRETDYPDLDISALEGRV
ncbi:ATP-dependent dethiobiotin synthetase BioD [Butyricimonas paravirosa]|uniref:ATP-dependent dethiobiotin synthetase BioD n=1 Tax=Butyricimonas paravirosa TaxID=1472417 RepID=UPI00210B1E43|nr:dethiobiotin synthase [Butyricimonas paravirosa]MCQ4874049.1 dethiobiotin synthase [Butyricimonas paravirosa]